MGPDRLMEGSMRDKTDPAMFSPDKDFYQYRRQVDNWLDMVVTSSKVPSNKIYKTVLANLGRLLYDRGLPAAQQSMVYEAQSNGLLNYKQDDQVKAVMEIVNLIAVDAPIASVTRLINSFNKVTSCRRLISEDVRTFISRFQGFGAEHLMYAGEASSSQIGKVLAINFLNNADLEESTSTNGKLQLIGFSQARINSSKGADMHEVPFASIQKVKDGIKNIAEVFKDRSVPKNRRVFIQYCNRIRMGVSSALKEIRTVLDGITQAPKPEEDYLVQLTRSESRRCPIMLDDDVTVLRNLSITYRSDTTAITKAQLDKTIDEKFNSLRALLSRQNNDKSDKGKSGNVYGNDGAGKKGNLKRKWKPPYCAGCGSNVHRRGDAECNTRVLRPRNASSWPPKQRKMKTPNKATTTGISFFQQAPTGRTIKLLRRSWSQI